MCKQTLKNPKIKALYPISKFLTAFSLKSFHFAAEETGAATLRTFQQNLFKLSPFEITNDHWILNQLIIYAVLRDLEQNCEVCRVVKKVRISSLLNYV